MQLGLIGYPLGHSKSPEIFARFFKENTVEGSYKLFPIEDIGELKNLIASQPSLVGFNVTIPHKQTVFDILDEVSAEAKAIKAVNTVKILRDDNGLKLSGYNTDCFGFKTSLLNFLGEYKPNKALILGAGGSSKAVAYVLDQFGINYSKVSRNATKEHLSYDELSSETIRESELIINTTPLGMEPNIQSCPAIDYTALTKNHFLFDLVYNPTETAFLAKGKQLAAKTKNGLEMLYLQAQKSWEIWNR